MIVIHIPDLINAGANNASRQTGRGSFGYAAPFGPKTIQSSERCYPLVEARQSRPIRIRKEGLMTRKRCASHKKRRFKAEVAIHVPGLEGLNKPPVWVFPELFVCLNCGKTEFFVPNNELRILKKEDVASAR